MPKMFLVTAVKEISFAVIAEDEASARSLARAEATYEASDGGAEWDVDDVQVVERRESLASVYAIGDLEYGNPAGDDSGKTIAEWCDELQIP